VKCPASTAKFNLTAWSMICCAIAIVVVLFAHVSSAQSVPYERTFPQSKAIVEKRLKELQSASAGHLPSLEGFTVPGDRPLDHFRRGYYQCTAQVSATSSGGSTVRVNATITAWYSDPSLGKAAYQVLPSNGRLEADFLDQLQEVLGNQELSPSTAPRANPSASAPRNQSNPPGAAVSAPASAARSKAPTGSPFSLGNPLGLDHMSSLATQKAVIDRRVEEQEKEVKGLEEILRNQAHPANLVAVRKKDTPVLANPIEDAKVLFLAAAEDEFEFLDANPNWVHVRISGISRGWIRRSSLEMPTADPDLAPAETESRGEPAHAETQPFHVGNEQVASFPGDWAPLLRKTVKIVTVQKAIDNATVTGPEAKLAFAKSLFDGQYADLIRTSSSVAGVVVIFDSEDGGMIAATMLALRQWKAGTLSDQAFWRRCLFDPREAFGLVSNP
jgi:hypothetical protein